MVNVVGSPCDGLDHRLGYTLAATHRGRLGRSTSNGTQ